MRAELNHGGDKDKVLHLWATTLMHPTLIAKRLGKDWSSIDRLLRAERAVNNPLVIKGDAYRTREGVTPGTNYQ